MVIFERESDDDGEYVSKRAASPDVSIETAAMQQLAAELVDGDIGSFALPMVSVLQNGDAQCFDFGAGAMEAMASFEVQPATRTGT